MDSSQKQMLITAIEKAIKREIGAYNFYIKEAVKAEYSAAESLFIQLANEEEKHKTYLQNELERLKTIVSVNSINNETDFKMCYRIPEFFKLKQNQPLPFIDMALLTMPADIMSGDYLETYVLERENRSPALGLFLHDVMGHGEKSLNLNSIIKLFLSKKCGSGVLDDCQSDFHFPAKLMANLNQHIYKICHENFTFVTSFYALLDYDKKKLTYASAGHEPPVLIRKNGDYIHLDKTELVLGGMANTVYLPVSIEIETGDVLALFSDGLTEVQDSSEQMFERENVIKAIKDVHDVSANEILNNILRKLREHVKAEPLTDDFSLAVLKIIKP